MCVIHFFIQKCKKKKIIAFLIKKKILAVLLKKKKMEIKNCPPPPPLMSNGPPLNVLYTCIHQSPASKIYRIRNLCYFNLIVDGFSQAVIRHM